MEFLSLNEMEMNFGLFGLQCQTHLELIWSSMAQFQMPLAVDVHVSGVLFIRRFYLFAHPVVVNGYSVNSIHCSTTAAIMVTQLNRPSSELRIIAAFNAVGCHAIDRMPFDRNFVNIFWFHLQLFWESSTEAPQKLHRSSRQCRNSIWQAFRAVIIALWHWRWHTDFAQTFVPPISRR